MWQLYALGSLFAAAGQGIVDKAAIVSDRKIDSMVATFWRIFFFTICTIVIGMTGLFGIIHFTFVPMVWIVATAGLVNSLFYTFMLRKIEIVSIVAITYLAPFAYLAVDTALLHTSLSAGEIAGIILMVLGGLGFALDGKTHRFKKEFTPLMWLMFVYNVLYTGVDAYGFKYVHMLYGTGSVAFSLSYSVLMTAGLLCIILFQRKAHLLYTRPAMVYIPQVLFSKSFDALNTVLWLQALALAAVSQVSAMDALEPLVFFVVTIIAQTFLRIRVNEKLGRSRLMWKAGAICFLVAGGILVS